jgi:hypothetical protein
MIMTRYEQLALRVDGGGKRAALLGALHRSMGES